jgi:tetratricopeptide (TPR) repeat protein
MRRTAGELLTAKKPEAVLLLSWQIWQLGDHPLADEVYNLALSGAAIEDHDLLLIALEYLCETQQWPRADGVLQQLLANEKLANRAAIWRLGSAINQRRGMLARSVACLEKAMDLEYQNLPEAIDLQVVRHDYQGLMNHYQQLALAVTMLEAEPPQEFLAKVVRSADRWRSLDPDATAACQLAAKSLQALGAKDLAWDYLTTPIGMKPNEAAPWHNLAHTLRGDGDFQLADRAFANAYQAEPTNAQILWERAQNLQQLGKTHEARQLYRDLASGTWQPRFQWIQQQARTFLNRN